MTYYLPNASIVAGSVRLVGGSITRLDVRQSTREQLVVREDAQRLDETNDCVDHVGTSCTRLPGHIDRHPICRRITGDVGQGHKHDECQPPRCAHRILNHLNNYLSTLLVCLVDIALKIGTTRLRTLFYRLSTERVRSKTIIGNEHFEAIVLISSLSM